MGDQQQTFLICLVAGLVAGWWLKGKYAKWRKK